MFYDPSNTPSFPNFLETRKKIETPKDNKYNKIIKKLFMTKNILIKLRVLVCSH